MTNGTLFNGINSRGKRYYSLSVYVGKETDENGIEVPKFVNKFVNLSIKSPGFVLDKDGKQVLGDDGKPLRILSAKDVWKKAVEEGDAEPFQKEVKLQDGTTIMADCFKLLVSFNEDDIKVQDGNVPGVKINVLTKFYIQY